MFAGHAETHVLVDESAHKPLGHDRIHVQFPSYPNEGGLAGHYSTQSIVRGSAKFPFVQVATQCL